MTPVDWTTLTPGERVKITLEGAADLLEKHGWTRFALARGRSGRAVYRVKSAVCFCAVGAVKAAAGFSNLAKMFTAYEQPALAAALDNLKAEVGEHITIFNDAPGRTQAEVVEALRSAARSASQAISEPRLDQGEG